MSAIDHLHDRIRKSRIRQGLSQASLARQTGVSQPTVANWESGSHVPRKAALERIGTALKVDALWLLSGDQTGITAYEYLEKPIRHLRIYEWPHPGQSVQEGSILGYMPFPSDWPDLFAVVKPETDDDVQRLLVVNPQITARAATRPVIARTGERHEIIMAGNARDRAGFIGQIISEISLY